MNHTFYIAASIAAAALVTMAIRFLPFLVLGSRKTPEFVSYLGRVLPYAVMAMLVVYCLKSVSLLSAPYGLPELIACLVVAALHVWKRSTLLSIVGGTACYMFLIQVVFA